jgi:hypothetical protein
VIETEKAKSKVSLAAKQELESNLVKAERLNPQILSNLKPEILWARMNCGKLPCKGKYS